MKKVFLTVSKPNILLIVVDSLKSDKCIGKNLSSITPNIDFLIKNGAAFSQAISPAAVSPVAMSSIFTGLFPFRTGMSADKFRKLDSDIITYVKILKKSWIQYFCHCPIHHKRFWAYQ